jgi:hypothetical protein
MVRIRPFRSLYYNTSSSLGASSLPLHQEHSAPLYHLKKILSELEKEEGNSYPVIRRLITEFKDQKVLLRDPLPFIYVYHIHYESDLSGLPLIRKGFIALGELSDYPLIQKASPLNPSHQSRLLKLLQSSMTLFSPLVMLYQDKRNTLNELLDEACLTLEPFIEVPYSKEIHRIYKITNPQYLKKLYHIMEKQAVLQLDADAGYHALQEFKKEMNEKKFQVQWGMMLFINILDQEGLLEELQKWFEYKIYPFSHESAYKRTRIEFFEDLRIEGYSHPHFGMALHGEENFYLLKLRKERVFLQLDQKEDFPQEWKTMDSCILDQFLFPKLVKQKIISLPKKKEAFLEYALNREEVLHQVRSGKVPLAFFVNTPVSPRMAELLQDPFTFPQASLALSTKPLEGLLMQPLEEDGDDIFTH